MKFVCMRPSAYAIWDGKEVAIRLDAQIIFDDNSSMFVRPEDSFVRGQFMGRGALGAASVEGMVAQEWLDLPGTHFRVGFSGKLLALKDSKDLQVGRDPHCGHRRFICGSTVDFSSNMVRFCFVGPGLLVIAHKLPPA